MKVKSFIYTLFLVVLITACKQSNNNNSDINNGVLQLKYKEIKPVLFFKSQLFENVTYIPLETKTDNLIGQQPFLGMYKGEYYILDRFGSKVILRFNGDGLFLNKIGKIGGGPNELLSISDFSVNRDSNRIELLCGTKSEIAKYTPDGQFIKKDHLNFDPYNFVIDHSNNYWFYLGYNHRYAKERLIKTDILLSKTEKFLPLETKLLPVTAATFSNSEKQISFFEPFNNTMYALDTKPTPVLKIDFGEYAIPEEFFTEDPFSGFEKLQKQGFANIYKFMQNDHFMIVVLSIQKTNKAPEFNHLIVNKRNGHVALINETAESDAFVTFADAQYLTNTDELVFMAQPQKLLEIKNNKDNDLFTKGIPENINEVSNPVITKCKLKDF